MICRTTSVQKTALRSFPYFFTLPTFSIDNAFERSSTAERTRVIASRVFRCKRIQCDEIWSFVGMKQKTADFEGRKDAGDVWTWTALCADTKLVPCWLIGSRDAECADQFITNLAGRLANRVQLTTDGHRVYVNAVANAFLGKGASGRGVDYAMLVELYGSERAVEARYSPAVCNSCRTQEIYGNPKQPSISTSYVERQNQTMRMTMRRFTWLTNAFSKKVENLRHTVALHFLHYNFARVHQTLKTTPAVADHVWQIEEIVELLGVKSN